jgi:hypothetical protein
MTQWVASLHPALAEELLTMAKSKEKGFDFHLEPLIRIVGLKRVIDVVGPKRVLEELGPKRVLEELGPKRVLEEIGLDNFLANLSAAQKRELKRRLA